MAFRRVAMRAAVSERLRLAGTTMESSCGSEISCAGSGVDLVRPQGHLLDFMLLVTRPRKSHSLSLSYMVPDKHTNLLAMGFLLLALMCAAIFRPLAEGFHTVDPNCAGYFQPRPGLLGFGPFRWFDAFYTFCNTVFMGLYKLGHLLF